MDPMKQMRRPQITMIRTFLIAAPLLLAACAHSSNTTMRRFNLDPQTPAVVAPGDLRLITMRPRQIPDPQNPKDPSPTVLCAEPSPDWATALAQAFQASGSGSAPSGPSASVSGSYNSAETITQMAGRTSGVVALRDGLYAACQAYANGILGQDAYSLILSQYGNLLVKLVSVTSGGNATSSAASPSGTAPATTAPSAGTMVSVLASGAAATPQQSTKSTPGTDSTSTSSPNDPMAEERAHAIGALLVACITESDPTRIRSSGTNPVLNQQTCGRLIAGLAEAAPDLLKPPVPAAKPITGTAKPVADPQVEAYQRVLQSEGFYKAPVDGVKGRATQAALRAYQEEHGLPVSGVADQPTLISMKLKAGS